MNKELHESSQSKKNRKDVEALRRQVDEFKDILQFEENVANAWSDQIKEQRRTEKKDQNLKEKISNSKSVIKNITRDFENYTKALDLLTQRNIEESKIQKLEMELIICQRENYSDRIDKARAEGKELGHVAKNLRIERHKIKQELEELKHEQKELETGHEHDDLCSMSNKVITKNNQLRLRNMELTQRYEETTKEYTLLVDEQRRILNKVGFIRTETDKLGEECHRVEKENKSLKLEIRQQKVEIRIWRKMITNIRDVDNQLVKGTTEEDRTEEGESDAAMTEEGMTEEGTTEKGESDVGETEEGDSEAEGSSMDTSEDDSDDPLSSYLLSQDSSQDTFSKFSSTCEYYELKQENRKLKQKNRHLESLIDKVVYKSEELTESVVELKHEAENPETTCFPNGAINVCTQLKVEIDELNHSISQLKKDFNDLYKRLGELFGLKHHSHIMDLIACNSPYSIVRHIRESCFDRDDVSHYLFGHSSMWDTRSDMIYLPDFIHAQDGSKELCKVLNKIFWKINRFTTGITIGYNEHEIDDITIEPLKTHGLVFDKNHSTLMNTRYDSLDQFIEQKNPGLKNTLQAFRDLPYRIDDDKFTPDTLDIQTDLLRFICGFMNLGSPRNRYWFYQGPYKPLTSGARNDVWYSSLRLIESVNKRILVAQYIGMLPNLPRKYERIRNLSGRFDPLLSQIFSRMMIHNTSYAILMDCKFIIMLKLSVDKYFLDTEFFTYSNILPHEFKIIHLTDPSGILADFLIGAKNHFPEEKIIKKMESNYKITAGTSTRTRGTITLVNRHKYTTTTRGTWKKGRKYKQRGITEGLTSVIPAGVKRPRTRSRKNIS